MITKRHVLDEKLSEAEKNQLTAFCENPLMMDAVKRVLLFPIYESGVIKKGEPVLPRLNYFLNLYMNKPTWDNEELGKEVKIRAEALLLIENAWMEIEGYQKEEEYEPGENPAR